jgi:hypothetical protein
MFADLHAQSWGKPLIPVLINLEDDDEGSDDDVLPGDTFLIVNEIHFLVRAEYSRVFNEVKNLYNNSHKNHLAVITGQPGIGVWISVVCSMTNVLPCVQEKPIGSSMQFAAVLGRSSPSSGTKVTNFISSKVKEW